MWKAIVELALKIKAAVKAPKQPEEPGLAALGSWRKGDYSGVSQRFSAHFLFRLFAGSLRAAWRSSSKWRPRDARGLKGWENKNQIYGCQGN